MTALMHTLHTLSLFSAVASAVLISAIWQGAILAMLVALCLRLLPGLSATARSLVWLGTFFAALLLHLTPFLPAHPFVAAVPLHPLHAGLCWSLLLAALWLGLSLIRGVQLVSSALHMWRIARHSIAIPSHRTLPRGARLCTSTEVGRPSVAGFFAPRILIPPAMLQAMTPAELEQVLLHETEHLRRNDDWINLLQKLALVVFPLNPVLLWVERRLCLERELACDDRVLASTATRRAYASCLTHLAEHAALRRGLSLALGAWERHSELALRVYRILAKPRQTLSKPLTCAATATVLAGVFGASLALIHAPQLVSFDPSDPGVAPVSESQPQVLAASFGAHTAGRQVLTRASMDRPSTPPPVWVSATAHVQQRPVDRRALSTAHRRSRTVRSLALYASLSGEPSLSERSRETMIVYRAFSQVLSVPAYSAEIRLSPDAAANQSSNRAQVQAARPVHAFTTSTPPVFVPVAAYAAVPMPNGWLIIQL